MSNLPTMNVAQLGQSLQAAANRTSDTADSMSFIRMDKTGQWVYGADEIPVQDGAQWAINPQSFMEGYIAWGEGEVHGEEMAPMIGAPVIAADLPVTAAKRGWEKQMGFQLACLTGEDAGVQVVFKSSSKGGIKSIRDMIKTVVEQINIDPTAVVPLVILKSDNYKHKTYGKIFTPVFDIQKWRGMDDTEVEVEAEAGGADPRRRRPAAS